MNAVIEAMIARRSCRKFKPEMPPKAEIEAVIEAGLYAASGMGKQSPIVIAVTDRKLRDRIADDNRAIGGWPAGFDPFYGAPVILIVLAPAAWPNRVYDGSLVIGNLMLAAHSLGLGSIWIHRAKEEFSTPEYRKLFSGYGLAGEWEGIGHCALGFRADELPPPPKRREGRVLWVE